MASSVQRTSLEWVHEVIRASSRGNSRLPLFQRRPLPGPFEWSSGGPVPESVSLWLGHDASWFARRRVTFGSLVDGKIPTSTLGVKLKEFLYQTPQQDTFEIPAALESVPCFLLAFDEKRNVSELLLAHETSGEPAVLAMRGLTWGASLGVGWPSFGAWLAEQAGLVVRPRTEIEVNIRGTVEAAALTRLVSGEHVGEALALAPELPEKAERIPLEPGVAIKHGFGDLLREAYEGNDAARIRELCRSPKAHKASRGFAREAARSGFEEAAIALLDFDPLAKQALHVAARNGRLKVLRACLARGMDPDEIVHGSSSREVAAEKQQQAVIDALAEYDRARGQGPG